MAWVEIKKRRGVTLVEMLVTLAVLLLMMTVVVQIFQAATGALNSAQVYQELDNQLRQLDGIIRSDLTGVTCRMTPPNNPMNNPGYFEYIENEFADVQGEDCDDTLRFTAKAPAGRPFTGRVWAPLQNAALLSQGLAIKNFQSPFQPITVTSDYAEIIYFLRNGNLYRRVLLVAPQMQSGFVSTVNNLATATYGANQAILSNLSFNPSILNGDTVSWQGMNDLSAHPAPTGSPALLSPPTNNSVILNSLADLTNRENRWPNQRFANDFANLAGTAIPDNVVDDFNGDNVPDYYPTLYNGILNAQDNAGNAKALIFPPDTFTVTPNYNYMAFPFIFPGAYSRPQTTTGANGTVNNLYGWIHSPEPSTVDTAGNVYQFDANPLNYLQNLNHNPIDIGDNLPLPSSGSGYQTWWGFPTWRETLSPFWTDPTWQLNTNQSQPFGLAYQPASGAVGNVLQFLPDMSSLHGYRVNPQPYNDGLPSNANPNPVPNGFFPLNNNVPPDLWLRSWEDDLIMTNVRSFDVKAYDNSLSAYADLGWGDDPRLTGSPTFTPQYMGVPLNLGTPPSYIPYLAGNYDPVNGYGTTSPAAYINNTKYDLLNQTFAHEGRIPPRVEDNRLDAQYGLAASYLPAGSNYLFPNGTYTGNIGDDQPGLPRLRRVWDSWSTEYTQAPGTGVNNSTGFPVGPPSQTPPVYPSYPPPYPAPLRGIQIQIRVTDPASQRIKTLTIRQDFTDKL